MNETLLICLFTLFTLGPFVICYDQVAATEDHDINNITKPITLLKIETNVLDITKPPLYQTMVGNFISTKQLSTSPTLVTEELFLEKAKMKDIGNVTNKMKFVNTYFDDSVIQGRGNGTIETPDSQSIGWTSSDIGVLSEKGLVFHGIILFSNTNSEKLSFKW